MSAVAQYVCGQVPLAMVHCASWPLNGALWSLQVRPEVQTPYASWIAAVYQLCRVTASEGRQVQWRERVLGQDLASCNLLAELLRNTSELQINANREEDVQPEGRPIVAASESQDQCSLCPG